MKNRKRLLTLALLCMAVAFSVLGLTACGNEGDNRDPGKSAYEIWLDNGFTGTEQDFLNWLKNQSNNADSLGLSFALTDEDTYSVSVGLATERSVIVIPATYNNKPVTKIANKAFNECTNLKKVTIPDSVTSIGEDAFRNCSSLNAVYITDIAAWCNIKFNNNSFRTYNLYLNGELVTKLVIPDSVTSIGYGAFYNCTSLTSITIPDSVTSIGEDAFYNCTSLISVTIGKGVTSIGNRAFFGCDKLVEVINKSNLNIDYGSIEALNIKTDGQSDIVNKNDYLFYTYNNINYLLGYVGNDTNLNLPDNYNGENYQIYKYAFSYCRALTIVTIPDSVTSIGDWAFRSCTSLSSVTMGKGVTSIGSRAFRSCTSLTSVTIPDSVTSIGGSAFSGCTSLTSVTIPDSVTSIGDSAFYECTSLTSVTIPDSVTSIGEDAFYNCTSLTSVTIGNGVTSIGSWAFSGCNNIETVFYKGGKEQWDKIGYAGGINVNELYFYSEAAPTDIGKYWHYAADGVTPVIW